MKRIRLFTAKYMPATNNRCSRIKITDLWRGNSKIIPYKGSRIDTEAEKYLTSRGIILTCDSGSPKLDYFGTEDFTTEL